MSTALDDAPTTERRWSFRSGALSALDFCFGIRSTHGTLGRYLATMLRPMRGLGPPDHWYSLVHQPDESVELFLDDHLLQTSSGLRHAADWLLWHIDEQAVASVGDDHVVLHAGGVQWGEQGILLPGRSGAGKSTVVAALVEAGFDYHSDEVVVLIEGGDTMLPYPRPISLRPGSQPALPRWRPRADGRWPEMAAQNWTVPVETMRSGALGGPCAPAMVIAPRYCRGAATALVPMPATETLLTLVTNSVHDGSPRAHHVHALARLSRTCPAYRLDVGDLSEACRLVTELLT